MDWTDRDALLVEGAKQGAVGIEIVEFKTEDLDLARELTAVLTRRGFAINIRRDR
jgi:hypothetical protein